MSPFTSVLAEITIIVDASSVRWSLRRYQSLDNPLYWWLTASSLKDGSEVLFNAIQPVRRRPSEQELDLARDGFTLAHPSHDLRSVYVMLVGFCLENVFKAEYMRQNEPSLADGKLPADIKEHDLLELARLTGFAVKADERAALRIASDAAVSWGRYPAGARHDKGGMSPPECFDLEHFRRAFEAVYWRLTEIITHGWT